METRDVRGAEYGSEPKLICHSQVRGLRAPASDDGGAVVLDVDSVRCEGGLASMVAELTN